MPVWWLAGNTENLVEYNFGAVSMGCTVEILEDAFTKISVSGLLVLDEDFTMTIFSDISDEVEPFEKYLHYMFNEKASNPVGTRAKEDKVKP